VVVFPTPRFLTCVRADGIFSPLAVVTVAVLRRVAAAPETARQTGSVDNNDLFFLAFGVGGRSATSAEASGQLKGICGPVPAVLFGGHRPSDLVWRLAALRRLLEPVS